MQVTIDGVQYAPACYSGQGVNYLDSSFKGND